jgi:hypothetical protein
MILLWRQALIKTENKDRENEKLCLSTMTRCMGELR